jgi:predicted alpha/beta superfamily hydrolase
MFSSSNVDQEYQIYIALPYSYADSNQIYPVVYVSDANGFFGMVTETVRLLQIDGQFPELLIVGIGYPVNRFMETYALRARDMSPTENDEWLHERLKSNQLALEPHGTGGSADFLRFIREELIPFIHSNYRTKPDDRIIAGDSFGGLFALYAMFHSPKTFNRYIIGSPSIHWGEEVTFEYEANYAANNSDLPAQVFMSVGSAEPEYMITDMENMARALRGRNYPSLELTTHVFDGETHLSVIPATMSRGLRTVFG